MCGNLSDPENGIVEIDESFSLATYSCNSGYQLVGNTTRVCLSSGEWSDSEPVCQCKFSISEL